VNGKAFLSRWRPALHVALAVTVVLAPLPALAGEPSPPAKPPGLLASVAKLNPDDHLTATSRPAARNQQAGAADLRSPSFFKTPVGIAVLATLGIGAGYAIYSTQHDRVHSAGKK
jgi:hypothetical protein